MKNLIHFLLLSSFFAFSLNASDQTQKKSFLEWFMSGWQDFADAYVFHNAKDADLEFMFTSLDEDAKNDYLQYSQPALTTRQENHNLVSGDSDRVHASSSSAGTGDSYQDDLSSNRLSSSHSLHSTPEGSSEDSVVLKQEAINQNGELLKHAVQNQLEAEQRASEYFQKASVLDQDIRSVKRATRQKVSDLEQKVLGLQLKNEHLRKQLVSLQEKQMMQNHQKERVEQKIVRAKGLEERERQLVIAQLREQDEKIAKLKVFIADLERELVGERVFTCRLVYQSSLGKILSQDKLDASDVLQIINIMNRLCGCNALYDEKTFNAIAEHNVPGRIIAVLDSFIEICKAQGAQTDRLMQLFLKFYEFLTTHQAQLGASKGILAGNYLNHKELQEIVRLLLQIRFEPEDVESLHVVYKQLINSERCGSLQQELSFVK